MPKTDRPQSRRAALLEFAVLGLLHDGPLHGYELRKRLTTALGIFRALSYGSLYPALKRLVDAGWIHETQEPTAAGKRPRITYELTADGKEHFQDLVAASGPDAWDDDDFDVRFAFFSRTEAQVRLRILEGRRSRLEERLANIRDASTRNRERMDGYTLALQQHGEDAPSARCAGSRSSSSPNAARPSTPAPRHTTTTTDITTTTNTSTTNIKE